MGMTRHIGLKLIGRGGGGPVVSRAGSRPRGPRFDYDYLQSLKRTIEILELYIVRAIGKRIEQGGGKP